MINLEISKGMYIRFKDKRGIQYIRKVTSVNTEEPAKRYAAIYIDKETNNCNGVSLKNIIGEPSFNIIDLIEVGDYINGYPVVDILECYDNDTKRKINRIVYIDKAGFEIDNRLTIVGNNDIKDIITKEQFDACKYAVERDTNESL